MAKQRVAKYVISLSEEGTRIETFARRAEDSLGRAGKSAKGFGDILRTGVGTAIGFLTANAIPRMGRAISDMVDRTSRVNSLETAFDSLSASIGLNADTMRTELRGATRGLISDLELLEKTNQALSFGIVESQEQWTLLAGAAVKAGRAQGIDALRSIESVTTALSRQSPLILDNLGVKLQLSEVNEEWAQRLGRTVASLTEEERATAFNTIATERLFELTERMGDASLVLGDRIDQAKVALTNWLDEQIRAFNESESMQRALERLSQAFGGAGGALDTIAAGFAAALPVLASGVETIAGLVDIVTAIPAPVFAAAGAFLGGQGLLFALASLIPKITAVGVAMSGAGLAGSISGLIGILGGPAGLIAMVGVGLAGAFIVAKMRTAEYNAELQRSVAAVTEMRANSKTLFAVFKTQGVEGVEEWAQSLNLAEDELKKLILGLSFYRAEGELTFEEIAAIRQAVEGQTMALGLNKTALDAAADGAGDVTDAMEKLNKALSKFGFVTEQDVVSTLDDLELALSSNQVTTEQLRLKVDELLARYETLGRLTPEVKARLDDLSSGYVSAKEKIEEMLKKQGKLETDTSEHWTPTLEEHNKVLSKLDTWVLRVTGKTADWRMALVDVFDTIRTGKQWLDNLISSVTKFIGSLLSGKGPLEAFQSSLAGIGGILGSLGGTTGGIAGNVLGALGSGGPLAGLLGGGAVAGGAATAGAVGGAAAGAAAGGGAAAAGGGGLAGMGALFSNPWTAVAAGGILGAIGLYKLFNKTREAARSERQADIFSDFGISQKTNDMLRDLSIEATKVGRALPDTIASIKGLGAVLRETGIKDANQFTFAASKAREGIERFNQGVITSEELTQSLSDVFPILVANFELAGETGKDVFEDMLRKLADTGVEVEAVTSLIEDQVAALDQFIGRAIGANIGATNVFAGSFKTVAKDPETGEETISFGSLTQGSDAAELLGLSFNTMAAELQASGSSILEILEKFKPTLDAANEAGVGLGGQFAFLQELSGKLADEGIAKLVDRSSALNTMLGSNADLGMLTQGGVDLFMRNMLSGHDELAAALGSENLALQVQGPLLANLRDIAERYGFNLSEATQGLIDNADTLGALPPQVETIEDILGDLREILFGIATAFGVDLPESVKRFRDRAGGDLKGVADDTATEMDRMLVEGSSAFRDLEGIAGSHLQNILNDIGIVGGAMGPVRGGGIAGPGGPIPGEGRTSAPGVEVHVVGDRSDPVSRAIMEMLDIRSNNSRNSRR